MTKKKKKKRQTTKKEEKRKLPVWGIIGLVILGVIITTTIVVVPLEIYLGHELIPGPTATTTPRTSTSYSDNVYNKPEILDYTAELVKKDETHYSFSIEVTNMGNVIFVYLFYSQNGIDIVDSPGIVHYDEANLGSSKVSYTIDTVIFGLVTGRIDINLKMAYITENGGAQSETERGVSYLMLSEDTSIPDLLFPECNWDSLSVLYITESKVIHFEVTVTNYDLVTKFELYFYANGELFELVTNEPYYQTVDSNGGGVYSTTIDPLIFPAGTEIIGNVKLTYEDNVNHETRDYAIENVFYFDTKSSNISTGDLSLVLIPVIIGLVVCSTVFIIVRKYRRVH